MILIVRGIIVIYILEFGLVSHFGFRVEKDPRVLFGREVRKLRKARGWSQEELADRCDLDRTYIGGIERGERNVALLNIYKIAKAIEVHPSKLIK